jgi:uncharacterized protein
MKTSYRYMAAILLMSSALLMSGCASSPRSQFYTLIATATEEIRPVSQNAPSITIASVTIPELIDRPQLVVRSDKSQVELLETHRWAEPLKSAIPRTIAENISRILAVNMVSSYPQNASFAADFRIYLDILRFESVDGGIAMDALWSIRASDGKPLQNGRSQLRERTYGNDYESIVFAFSRGLGSISMEIALALQKNWLIRK